MSEGRWPLGRGRGRLFFFSSRRRHTRFKCDWSSDVCSSDLEWAEGQPLADVVPRSGPLAPALVADLVRQLAAALAAAHQAGIIHRDLKPENIIYDRAAGRVKLLHFGLARDADLPADERLTRPGFFVGTLKDV